METTPLFSLYPILLQLLLPTGGDAYKANGAPRLRKAILPGRPRVPPEIHTHGIPGRRYLVVGRFRVGWCSQSQREG